MSEMSPVCREFLNRMRSELNRLYDALDQPNELLKLIKALVKKMMKVPEPDLSGVLAAVPDFGSDLHGALSSMMNCPFIANSSAGGPLAEVLDLLGEGEDVPGDLKDSITSGTKKALADQIKALTNNSPTDQLDRLGKAYENAFVKSGAVAILYGLEAVYQCVESACSGYAAATSEAAGIMDAANETYDTAGGNLATPMADEIIKETIQKDTSYPDGAADEFLNKKSYLDTAKADIGNISLPW